MSIEAQDVIASDLPDLSDLTLAEGAGIDDEEYARIMRRVHGGGEGTDTTVSAFNSSI